MKIVKYNNKNDIDILFDNGYIAKNRRYYDFKNGSIKNVYYPSVLNKGYVGEGEYRVSNNNKATIAYEKWNSMLSRCYSKHELKRYPKYQGCEVVDEWLNYQNFAKWFYDNYYEIENQIMCLDKDILCKNNKIYSPTTCCIVPNDINVLLTKSDTARGKYYIGVTFDKAANMYVAQCQRKFKTVFIGYFPSETEAFLAYKKAKEQEVKDRANEYKDKLPFNVYEALINYEVEITD